jgi:membrane-associated phospholipid phosphatase
VRYASAFLASGFAALAALVATGATNGIDRWAIDHAMPGAQFSSHTPSTAEALVPLLHVHWHGAVHVLAEIVTLPASFLVSLLVLLALRRWAWIVVWAAGNVVEETCKTVLARPALYHHGLHLAAFDHSYPSGHTIRVVVLAAAIGHRSAWAWAVAAIVLLEAGGFHVPTDIAGGLLLAALLLGLRLRLGFLALRR